MSITSRKRPIVVLSTILALGAASTASARPNMWWDHFQSQAADQSECVKQAEAILTAENAGQLASDSDSVRAWTQQTVTVAECLSFGDQLIVALLVSSDDPSAGNKIFYALKSGLKKQ